MHDIIIFSFSIAVLVMIVAAAFGIVMGFIALAIASLFIRGHVTWGFFEGRVLIPVIQKLIRQNPGQPVSPRIRRYLDSANTRGLI